MNTFAGIKINSGWRQFGELDIDLSHQVTVLTGQNGCGKTTILSLLSKHFGWNLHLVATPYVSKRKARKWWSDTFGNSNEKGEPQEGQHAIGKISYHDGPSCSLTVKKSTGAQYAPDYSGIQQINGLHIPAHRQASVYSSVGSIPTQPVSIATEYQSYQQLLAQQFSGGKSINPGSVQKKSLISLALFGEGNSSVTPNPELLRAFEGFQAILKGVLPPHLGFQRMEIRMPEIVLVTNSGDFSLDAMSGGIGAIFGIAWQIYMFGFDKDIFTVTIDEPENHLHPTMQRTLLPNLAKAFPRCRFIVATHSPFIVSSFEKAKIVALIQDSDGKFVSDNLTPTDISGTPNEVLREILSVSSNLPVWVEREIDRVILDSANIPVRERATLVMRELARLGISDAIVEYNQEGDS